jgi:hypothetical protein
MRQYVNSHGPAGELLLWDDVNTDGVKKVFANGLLEND